MVLELLVMMAAPSAFVGVDGMVLMGWVEYHVMGGLGMDSDGRTDGSGIRNTLVWGVSARQGSGSNG